MTHQDSPATARPIALVTGGAKRIGAAICHNLAADHDIIIHANSSIAEAETLAASLHAAGTHAWALQADLQDPDAVQKLLDDARALCGHPITVLINNASRFPEQNLADATWNDLEAMVRLHAWAPLALTRALAAQPDLAPGACVVNLLDTRITSIDREHVPYLLSKQMLADATHMAARHLAPAVRVNAVAPGPILPPSSKTGTAADEELERGAAAVPLGRAGTAPEIAHAVRFLVENQYVTGQTVFVDGGRHTLG